MALISTRVHGALDYLTAGTLVALPRVMGWKDGVDWLVTNTGIGTVGYSVITRYELGLVKVLPMKAHLALDAISGVLFCAAPLLFPDEDTDVKAMLVGIGVFELAVTMLTETEPS